MPSSVFKSEEHTSELQSHDNLVCRLLLEKKKSRGSEEHTSELQSHYNLVCRLLLGKKSARGSSRRARRSPCPRTTRAPAAGSTNATASSPTTSSSFFFLMSGRPPTFTLFPSPALSS